MHSSLIGKVEKAKTYAQERHRMQIDGLHVSFHGENSDHEVAIKDGAWSCNCDFFASWQVCSHTMALERVLSGMVPQQQELAAPVPV
ncbi:MAG: hypothetical protein HYX53_16535 [Chloroflexi bacterium]|nr:hypothetical protein [Chloroflexota bacterium]